MKRTLVAVLVILVALGIGWAVFGPRTSDEQARQVDSHPAAPSTPNEKGVTFVDERFGLSVSLPESWRGFTSTTSTWESFSLGQDGQRLADRGTTISIRHPHWTADAPRQDIPIMAIPIDAWGRLERDETHIGAAPIGPTKLAENSMFVFALPARYNYAFIEGYEEVDAILMNGAVTASEPKGNRP